MFDLDLWWLDVSTRFGAFDPLAMGAWTAFTVALIVISALLWTQVRLLRNAFGAGPRTPTTADAVRSSLVWVAARMVIAVLLRTLVG